MNHENPAFNEVLEAHVGIQQWLSGEAPTDQLARLLARFSPRYSMIGLSGQMLDYPGPQALFAQAHGKREGLQFRIDQWQEVACGPSLWVVSYREWQRDAQGAQSLRRSTVVFERGNDTLQWLHLHETPASA